MLDPLSQSNLQEPSATAQHAQADSGRSTAINYSCAASRAVETHSENVPPEQHHNVSSKLTKRQNRYRLPSFLHAHKSERARVRRLLTQPFVLKLFDAFYWKRLCRYLYIRFLRMRGSPKAIARGVAAGVFAGSFPLLGFQTLVGVAIAALVRGNKLAAAASTWISNPLTYVPFFMLNFQIGRWLLHRPKTAMELPTSPNSLDAWMSLGASATAALLLGSFVVGLVLSTLAYSCALRIAHRVHLSSHSSSSPN